MRHLNFAFVAALALMAGNATAATVSYNTTGSTLACNGVSGCVQNTSTSITIGGITLTYNAGSGSGVAMPSYVNLGNIVTTGTSSGTNIGGVLLTINVNSTPPGASGTLPPAMLTGTIATNSSSARLSFGGANTVTTASYGALPGVQITGGGFTYAYQVVNTSVGLQAPTVGNPVGQTSLQGAVSQLAAPASAVSMTISTGGAQSTSIQSTFATPLAVKLTDAGGAAVANAAVTFTAPASGATSVFATGTTTTVVNTNASGVASVTATANSIAGAYAVVASALGYSPTTFSLANTTGTVSFNTTGSTLSCNGVAGCVQNTSTSITIGGLTMTYNAGSGSGVAYPSVLNFGNLVSTGTSAGSSFTGVLLTINVNSTPPGASGTLPSGMITGSLGTNNSAASITFAPNNLSTTFGALPSVIISGAGQNFAYQVLNNNLTLEPPTVGNPVGQTSIQGAVSLYNALTSRAACDLDVDGNGTIDALTDRLIVLRAMLGLTGTAVTSNAVGAGANRTTWANIQPFLNAHCGTNFAP